jgi:hypothetical protein
VLLQLHRSALAPAALLLVAGDVLPAAALGPGDAAIVLRFEGREAVVDAQVEMAQRLGGGIEWPEEKARPAWDALCRSAEPSADTTLLHIATLPIDVAEALAALAESGMQLQAFVGQFGVGTSHAHATGVMAAQTTRLRDRLATRGARLEIQSAMGVRARGGPADPVLADLAHRTHAAFDAAGRFAPPAAPGG